MPPGTISAEPHPRDQEMRHCGRTPPRRVNRRKSFSVNADEVISRNRLCKQRCVAKMSADGKRVGVTSSPENVLCSVVHDQPTLDSRLGNSDAQWTSVRFNPLKLLFESIELSVVDNSFSLQSSDHDAGGNADPSGKCLDRCGAREARQFSVV